MSWLTLTLPDQLEAPPNYEDVAWEEEFSRHVPPYPQPPNCEGESCCPMFACIQEFRFQPPPLYSEVNTLKGNQACAVLFVNNLVSVVDSQLLKDTYNNFL